MPLLSCSAVKCIYNTQHRCGKADILVSGDQAKEACETCCSSFREDGLEGAKNALEHAGGKTWVNCTACGCRYNQEEECHAEKVDISGASACQCRQTECSTFACA